MAGIAISALLLTACSSDDNAQIIPDDDAFSNGVLILNEGGFGMGNASVSFLSDEGVLTNNIYDLVNNSPLGDTGQSMYFDGDRAYIVVNGSGKIEVVDRYTFENIGTITDGLMNPRYMVIENGKGYVSNWGNPADPLDDYIAEINLNTLSVSANIPVVEGPEQMVVSNGKIYVAHMGGWGFGNSVSVVRASNNAVSEIQVGDIPESMYVYNDVLYVLCSGKAEWTGEETQGKLFGIDTLVDLVAFEMTFPTGQHPENMVREGNTMYYTIADQVFATNADMPGAPANPLFSMSGQGVFGAYGFAVNNGKIYVGDAGDYVSNGTLYIYDVAGNLLEQHIVGPLPNYFGFNN